MNHNVFSSWFFPRVLMVLYDYCWYMADKSITKGKLVVDVTYFIFHVHSETHDFCSGTPCPASGEFVLASEQTLPSFTPPVSIPAVHIQFWCWVCPDFFSLKCLVDETLDRWSRPSSRLAALRSHPDVLCCNLLLQGSYSLQMKLLGENNEELTCISFGFSIGFIAPVAIIWTGALVAKNSAHGTRVYVYNYVCICRTNSESHLALLNRLRSPRRQACPGVSRSHSLDFDNGLEMWSCYTA
jgi:hypothetical protein